MKNIQGESIEIEEVFSRDNFTDLEKILRQMIRVGDDDVSVTNMFHDMQYLIYRLLII